MTFSGPRMTSAFDPIQGWAGRATMKEGRPIGQPSGVLAIMERPKDLHGTGVSVT
jgi:hypothetical protein